MTRSEAAGAWEQGAGDFGRSATIGLNVSGALGRAQARVLGGRLQRLVDQGHGAIRLDLAEVRAVDASVLAVLARIHVDLIERGGALTLAHPTADVRRSIEASGRGGVFHIEP